MKNTLDKLWNITKKLTLLLFTIFVAFIMAGITSEIVEQVSYKSDVSKYTSLSEDNIDELYSISNNTQLMYNIDVVSKFENMCLGNTNINLLQYGKYCSKDNIICKSSDKTYLVIDNKQECIADIASYINIIDSNVYYRSDNDYKIYKYNMQTKKDECIIDDRCSMVIVCQKYISYIDMNTGKLCYISLDTGDKSIIENYKVDSFAVIGNKYLTLTEEGELLFIDKDGTTEIVGQDIDRFLYNGEILIQSGNSMYILDIDSIPKKSFFDQKGVVLNVDANYIYVYENKALNVYSIDDRSLVKNLYYNENEIIKSMYICDNSYYVILYVLEDGIYKEQVVEIKIN